MVRKLQSSSHCSHLILYYLMFCAKYRGSISTNKPFDEAMKQEFADASKKHDFTIDTVDLNYSKSNYIHILIRSVPILAQYKIVRALKQEINIWTRQNFDKWLSTFYWKSYNLFTR